MPALHLKPWDDQRLLADSEHTGKKSRVTAGSYIDDLAELRKTITLCSNCSPKFNAASRGYVTERTMPLCTARCDGCKETGGDRRLYLHHRNMPRL